MLILFVSIRKKNKNVNSCTQVLTYECTVGEFSAGRVEECWELVQSAHVLASKLSVSVTLAACSWPISSNCSEFVSVVKLTSDACLW